MMRERRVVEVRSEESGRISAVVVRYGDEARIGATIRERIAPGAFGPVADLDVLANLEHRTIPFARTGGGGLTLTDSDEELRAEIHAPEYPRWDEVVDAVRRRVLRGASVEMVVREEKFTRSGETLRREVRKAVLYAVSLVSNPAFIGSTAEARSVEEVIRRRAETAAAFRRPSQAWLL